MRDMSVAKPTQGKVEELAPNNRRKTANRYDSSSRRTYKNKYDIFFFLSRLVKINHFLWLT